jgi:hypothetical protein
MARIVATRSERRTQVRRFPLRTDSVGGITGATGRDSDSQNRKDTPLISRAVENGFRSAQGCSGAWLAGRLCSLDSIRSI